mgnify:CR=1 FL=1
MAIFSNPSSKLSMFLKAIAVPFATQFIASFATTHRTFKVCSTSFRKPPSIAPPPAIAVAEPCAIHWTGRTSACLAPRTGSTVSIVRRRRVPVRIDCSGSIPVYILRLRLFPAALITSADCLDFKCITAFFCEWSAEIIIVVCRHVCGTYAVPVAV